MKSPIFYPGSKRYAVKQIRAHFPLGLTEMVSPFFGGGSVELSCVADGVRVHGYDAFGPLVDFWQAVLENPKGVGEIARSHYPLSKEKFGDLKRRFEIAPSSFERGALYYVLNKSSFGGMCGSYAGESYFEPGKGRNTFHLKAIGEMERFVAPSLSVHQADFLESIASHPDMFLYMDPPYVQARGLYGLNGDLHFSFDHEALAGILHDRVCWVLSYDDCAEVRALYTGHRFVNAEWGYRLGKNSKSRNEVLILSHDLDGDMVIETGGG